MQRSPVIFWLLLAATICVDAVAIAWLIEGGFEVAAVTLYIALGLGQLSALCAWVVLFHARLGLRWLAPFIAGFAFALLLSYTPGRPFVEALFTFATLMWVHVALILSLLWFLKPTRIFARLSDRSNQPSWQFAIRHLLILMTCVAVLVSVLRRAQVLVEEPGAVVFFTIGNVVLLIAIIAATQTRWPWPLRLVASLVAAIVIAGICEWTQTAFADEINFFAFALIQAIVIWSWLEHMRPVPATGLPAAVNALLPE